MEKEEGLFLLGHQSSRKVGWLLALGLKVHAGTELHHDKVFPGHNLGVHSVFRHPAMHQSLQEHPSV